MQWVAAVILAALIEYFALGFSVGRARAKYKIIAPAITGHEIFERHFRVHQNTLEQLILFVPAVWLFGLYVSPLWASLIGLVFIVGRLIYAVGYVRDPARREIGAVMSFAPQIALLIGAAIGVIRAIVLA
ncbi:MAG TPA: MAPEG family protein [Steroidobacteraceae bacterium]|nr:MAPEG family protein [Steroidobacteraceae bacterium]